MAVKPVVEIELGLPSNAPEWLNRPALTRITASGQNVLRWFKGYNVGREFAEQIKPANFLLIAHTDPLDPSGALPIAPYNSDASRWQILAWVDRRTGLPIRVTTDPLDGDLRPGFVRVKTYGDTLRDYLVHPESKSLGPKGESTGADTRGVLRCRSVMGIRPVRYIGKEANHLGERLSGLETDPFDYVTEYVDPERTDWTHLVVPVLKTMDIEGLAIEARLHRRVWSGSSADQPSPPRSTRASFRPSPRTTPANTSGNRGSGHRHYLPSRCRCSWPHISERFPAALTVGLSCPTDRSDGVAKPAVVRQDQGRVTNEH
jgi:hypothetical protein